MCYPWKWLGSHIYENMFHRKASTLLFCKYYVKERAVLWIAIAQLFFSSLDWLWPDICRSCLIEYPSLIQRSNQRFSLYTLLYGRFHTKVFRQTKHLNLCFFKLVLPYKITFFDRQVGQCFFIIIDSFQWTTILSVLTCLFAIYYKFEQQHLKSIMPILRRSRRISLLDENRDPSLRSGWHSK